MGQTWRVAVDRPSPETEEWKTRNREFARWEREQGLPAFGTKDAAEAAIPSVQSKFPDLRFKVRGSAPF